MECHAKGGPKAKTRGAFRRTPFTMVPPRLFPYNVILLASWTSKERFLSFNGLPREYHGQYLSFAGQTLVELNPNILVRGVERMYVQYMCLELVRQLSNHTYASCPGI